jgi:hypothetical protein
VIAGGGTLLLISPVALIVKRLQRWRRGDMLQSTLEIRNIATVSGDERRCVDLTLDVPAAVEPGVRRRVTDTVVRIAESLRAPDDVYNVLYSPSGDPEPVVLPVGPQLQELGERFFLTLTQGPLAGRTVVWLTLGRDVSLSDVVDPLTCDPEAVGEPEGLLASAEARWSMASEWAQVGPSLVIRLMIVVPAAAAAEVEAILQSLR